MEKKYYWLKLTEGFFKDKPIKKLRKMAGGDTFTIIYLKMLLKAIGQENRLYFEGVEETFHEELALELDEESEDVRLALAYLTAKGLVRVMNEDEFLLTQCDEMVGSETDAARRKRLSRTRQKLQEEREAKALEDKSDKESVKQEGKPKKETTDQIYHRLLEEKKYEISEPLREKLETWFRYKMERREPYKETGLHTLLKQVEKHEAQYGTDKMLYLIDKCIGRQWKGIIFDVLKEEQESKRPVDRITNRVSEVDNW